MNSRLGTFILQKTAGETFKSYRPPQLPPIPPIDLAQLYPKLEKATAALATLNASCKMIPNIALFIYMCVCKEALLSNHIEGTQGSLSDLILFEHHHEGADREVSLQDIEEISNYVKAVHYGHQQIRENFPLSMRLLKQIHQILLSGSRGSLKLPGEIRRSQNWIGGTRPGNALFVPPSIQDLDECISNFEYFLHDGSLPLLIKAGIAHLQFESIYPFLDGNGRLGRLLIILLLCHGKLLDEPILYLSLYLKKHRQLYYDLLQEVRLHGTWEVWLEFFLEGIEQTATQASIMTIKLQQLFLQDTQVIASFGRARFSCEKIFELIKKLPQVSGPVIARELAISLPTARSGLERLRQAGILKEITKKKRDRIYIYHQYLSLLESDNGNNS